MARTRLSIYGQREAHKGHICVGGVPTADYVRDKRAQMLWLICCCSTPQSLLGLHQAHRQGVHSRR